MPNKAAMTASISLFCFSYRVNQSLVTKSNKEFDMLVPKFLSKSER